MAAFIALPQWVDGMLGPWQNAEV